jgi:hypothetical protein
MNVENLAQWTSPARLKLWTWNLFSVTVLGVIYWSVIAEGLRFLVPFLGQRLSKLPIPGFSRLADFEWTHRLDLANAMSVFLFIAMWNLWGLLLKAWLGTSEVFQKSGWDAETYKTIVLTLGVVVLGADGVLFYIAMTQMGWAGTRFSLSALLATCMWVAVLVFVKLVSINLEKEV